VKGWVRLREQLRFAHVVTFDVGRTLDKRVRIVDRPTCIDSGISYCISHVVCESLSDVTECSNMKVRKSANVRDMVILSRVTPGVTILSKVPAIFTPMK